MSETHPAASGWGQGQDGLSGLTFVQQTKPWPDTGAVTSHVSFEPGVVTTPVIPARGRLRWEDPEFKASLGYVVRPHPKETKQQPCRVTEGGPERVFYACFTRVY